MAYLTVRIKDVAGHSSEPLEGGERFVVGRTSAANITIRHESVSREHCAFVLQDGAWYVEDCGSANGTRVNSDRIEGRTILQERDIIKIGKARLTFHVSERSSRQSGSSERRDAAIALDDDGNTTPVRQRQPGEPAEAMPCTHCGTWFSVAHRLPGERIPCPRCDRQNTVPIITLAESDAAAIAPV